MDLNVLVTNEVYCGFECFAISILMFLKISKSGV